MGYPIIFETKIVKLTDGRIIHFDLSGCNNDTAGRSRDEFSAQLYTVEEFTAKAKKYMENSKPYSQGDGWNLKIGSRYATMYDYGMHLLRMLKRAPDYETFIKERYVSVRILVNVELIKPEHKILSVQEFVELPYNFFNGEKECSYIRNLNYLYSPSEQELLSLIEGQQLAEICIGRKYSRSVA